MIYHDSGHDPHHGWYASQDRSPEHRTWTCTTVIPDRLTGCTTHLSIVPAIAMRQCHELMSILASPWVLPEVIVAGDFNLRFTPGKPYNAQDCATATYYRRGDGDLQQVFSRNVDWVRGGREPMRWTDHPLLYEEFRI
jgi:hypothetical protein